MADLKRDVVPPYRVTENTSTPGFPYPRMSVGSWSDKKKAPGWESPEALQKEHWKSVSFSELRGVSGPEGSQEIYGDFISVLKMGEREACWKRRTVT